MFVSPDEMARRVRDLVEESYPAEIEDFDTGCWWPSGCSPRVTTSFRPRWICSTREWPAITTLKTGELVVATSDSDQPLPAIDQITLAHEMIHALTDATLGIPEAIEDPAADPEIIRAEQALIEGDATLGMQQFSLGALGFEEQLAMMTRPPAPGRPARGRRVPLRALQRAAASLPGRDELYLRPVCRRRMGGGRRGL